ncbi:enhancing factor (viral) [Listeria weihenstephanensis]|uniref:Enhancing factor (Viral) n=1 Tax=Listeria weihenstephanensis TaxID=1006155 RepID=A0A841Z4D6_9LIST|nr:putative mucin/carbohydrate-binding domain-containing protein [Listeria weihenstephanensis]MBC1500140.1 enhancing factor (viral) [Listeria weihenstephanensis]
MNQGRIRTIILAVFLIAVVGIFSAGGLKVGAATVKEKKLYTLENPTWMRTQGLSKGIDHDRQNLGVILPKGATIEIRQTNAAYTENLTLELLNDDRNTESYATVGSSWVKVTANSELVPFIRTTFTKDAPIVEYKVSDTAIDLPIYNQGDNEAAFFNKWDESNASFGLVGNKYIQILVPTKDKAYLKKMDDFTSIDGLLAYYDTLFETYNKLEGLSFTPEKATDKNIANRYFAKADKHGAGAAYYGGSYTAETSDSVIGFWLKPGWGGLHEIGHGYQGSFMGDSTFTTGEVWNNLYADSMQKKMLGTDYYNGWLYTGNAASLESYFEKNVFTTKIPVNNWDLRSKLYMLTLMKDKAGDDAFAHFNQAYRAASNAKTVPENARLLDLMSKYFGETSHYDFTPYLELVQGPMSAKQKAENLYSGNKAVYPLAALLSGDNLKKARKDINLDSKWGLVSNDQLGKYKLNNTATIEFTINDFTQLKGKTLRIKDGADVLREIKITTPTMTIKNMPVGIYSLDIPTGVNRFYEPSTNYLAVSDRENTTTITMNELQTSDIAIQKMIFKGLGDGVFAIATVDPEKGSLNLNVTSSSPHSYFASEYASIEVLNEQGESVFKHVMNGNNTVTGDFETAIKPGYTIKIMHKEPGRFNIQDGSSKLTNTSMNQTFKVTKYGLVSDVTGVTAQDALANFKEKLVTAAEFIRNDSIIKDEDNASLKTKLRKAIDYLADTDTDKIKYQQDYADILASKKDNAQTILSGDHFKFQMNGLGDWNFANLRIDLETNKATITQKAGEPHWYFAGTYATVKITNSKGKEVFAKDFNGRGNVAASENNVNIAIGDFITVTHQESAGRLIATNEQTGERYETYQEATYLVTADGLKKVATTTIPRPNPDEFTGQNFEFKFNGLSDWNFASMALDLTNKKMQVKQNAGEPHWYIDDTYASIKLHDSRGKLVYTKDFKGRGKVASSLDNLKIDQGYYITIMHWENQNRLLFTNLDTKEAYATSKQATYKITADGLLKVTEDSIPMPSLADVDGDLFTYKFLGLGDWNFANMSVDLSQMELTFTKNAGKPHVYFDKTVPYASIQVKDQDGSNVYSYTMIGNENLGTVLKKIKLEQGYYLVINHREANGRLKMAVDNVAQAGLPAQNVYQIGENGLVKKELIDVPAPTRFTKAKIYSDNIDFAFKGLSDNQFATLHLDKVNSTIHVDIKAAMPHYYFSTAYASIEVSDGEGKVVYSKEFIGNVTQKAETLSIPIKEGYTIKINHQEPGRLIVTDSATKERYNMAVQNEYLVVANGLIAQ